MTTLSGYGRMMLGTLSLFLLSLTVACNGTEEDQSARDPGRMAADDLISRQDFARYDVDEVHALHYAEAAAALGALRYAEATGDDALKGALADRWQRILDEDIPNTANHVDANLIGLYPLALARMGAGKPEWTEWGLALADGQWEDLTEDGLTAQARYWIDDVWMIGALQAEAYRLTEEPRYADRAGRMAAAYVAALQEPNGLFHHGPNAPFFWGRGNGWVAAGLAEVLTILPHDHPDYPAVMAGYQKMMAALLQYQAEDGMWRQLIDVEEAWKETSGTAMFAYAMTVGAKEGWLDDPAYAAASDKAWDALQTYLTPEGRLENVCVGTGQSQDIAYYLERPTVIGDLHGQAPLLWLAAARLGAR